MISTYVLFRFTEWRPLGAGSKGGAAMSDAKRDGRFELTPEQQQIVDDGLRILARMIVRRFQQDARAADGDGRGDGQGAGGK